ncbi:MAG: arylsulfatase [Planctomycetes bacterium]|nr:arylsulfatase [Planctomycetota bacterium]
MMTVRTTVARTIFMFAIVLVFAMSARPARLIAQVDTTPTSKPARKPNIIFILADDLGYREVSSYGQRKYKTPNIDRLADAGMRFTHFYSGSPVCAPSRCTLLTGKHTGHAYIRNNYEMGGWGPDEPEGQLPLADAEITIAELLQHDGYATCAIGKWGLGGPESEGHPNNQGFDHWFGYLCQRVAHNYYPTHLWRNADKVMLDGNEYFSSHQRLAEAPGDPAAYDRFKGKQYAPDLMIDEALTWVRDHKDEPFFLYYATPVPHAALQVPDESLEPYLDKKPYLGNKGYLPHPTPRAAYAAMVSRMDGDIGKLLDLLDDLNLTGDTIVFFTSDNGPTFNGGTDSEFFSSAGIFRGLKCSVYEGGIRIPMIVRWPGHVEAGAKNGFIGGFWDVMPTILDLAELDKDAIMPDDDIDGISFASTLTGMNPIRQADHDYLYWEYGGTRAIRLREWKAVWPKNKDQPELYNLAYDVMESKNVAEQYPDVMKRILSRFESARTESEHFPLKK